MPIPGCHSPGSAYLLCTLCGTPAQEASPQALQTEGMWLPADWTGEIRGLTAVRASTETGGGGVQLWEGTLRDRQTGTMTEAGEEWQLEETQYQRKILETPIRQGEGVRLLWALKKHLSTKLLIFIFKILKFDHFSNKERPGNLGQDLTNCLTVCLVC